MAEQRPPISQRAREILEEYKRRITFAILHEAEKQALQSGKMEIGEADVEKAAKVIVPKSSSARKWCIRILTGLIASLLLLQLGTFTQLTTISLELQVLLYLPSIIFLMWVIVFSYIFREELL